MPHRHIPIHPPSRCPLGPHPHRRRMPIHPARPRCFRLHPHRAAPPPPSSALHPPPPSCQRRLRLHAASPVALPAGSILHLHHDASAPPYSHRVTDHRRIGIDGVCRLKSAPSRHTSVPAPPNSVRPRPRPNLSVLTFLDEIWS
ncbi:hypothetical protein [Oryza sativa Japonica Group]|uniref:Uncharacterized protein n=1 Tax=Oryza sativa subsp. japonica TaxID=39947 RepID=Q5ZCL7_ORYSJ|nr:hypothetical protein [Oryza sativa Japonica Group]